MDLLEAACCWIRDLVVCLNYESTCFAALNSVSSEAGAANRNKRHGTLMCITQWNLFMVEYSNYLWARFITVFGQKGESLGWRRVVKAFAQGRDKRACGRALNPSETLGWLQLE